MSSSFGQVIPVTGLLFGFPGNVSRLGERVIAAREVLATTAHSISFGSSVIIVPASDTYQSVADFIAGGGTFTAARFSGVAIREVTTQLGYPYTPGAQNIGNYPPGAIAEVLERGSIAVLIQAAAAGTPTTQNALYVRVALNPSYSAALVGGFEVSADAAVNTTGTASSGSTALTVASGTGIVVGQIVTGVGIAPGTSVAVVAGTAVTLSQNTTAALSTTAVNFASNVQIPNLVFRTNQGLDANGIAEVTILTRVAA
jgi:hypothetical protein